jgi:hypothetical protein
MKIPCRVLVYLSISTVNVLSSKLNWSAMIDSCHSFLTWLFFRPPGEFSLVKRQNEPVGIVSDHDHYYDVTAAPKGPLPTRTSGDAPWVSYCFPKYSINLSIVSRNPLNRHMSSHYWCIKSSFYILTSMKSIKRSKDSSRKLLQKNDHVSIRSQG